MEHKKDEKISIESFLQSQLPFVPVIDVVDNNEQVSKFSKNIKKSFDWQLIFSTFLFLIFRPLASTIRDGTNNLPVSLST